MTDKLKKPTLTGKKKGGRLTKEDIYPVRLVSSVVTINGEEHTMEEKVDWVNNLIGRDSQALRSAFDDYDFGVDPSFQVKCSSCNENFQSVIPGEEFFRL